MSACAFKNKDQHRRVPWFAIWVMKYVSDIEKTLQLSVIEEKGNHIKQYISEDRVLGTRRRFLAELYASGSSAQKMMVRSPSALQLRQQYKKKRIATAAQLKFPLHALQCYRCKQKGDGQNFCQLKRQMETLGNFCGCASCQISFSVLMT